MPRDDDFQLDLSDLGIEFSQELAEAGARVDAEETERERLASVRVTAAPPPLQQVSPPVGRDEGAPNAERSPEPSRVPPRQLLASSQNGSTRVLSPEEAQEYAEKAIQEAQLSGLVPRGDDIRDPAQTALHNAIHAQRAALLALEKLQTVLARQSEALNTGLVKRTGSSMRTQPDRLERLAESQDKRFWALVKIVDEKPVPGGKALTGRDKHWQWLGPIHAQSQQPVFSLGKRTRMAHRVAWEMANKEALPNERQLRKFCSYHLCVNPNPPHHGFPMPSIWKMPGKASTTPDPENYDFEKHPLTASEEKAVQDILDAMSIKELEDLEEARDMLHKWTVGPDVWVPEMMQKREQQAAERGIVYGMWPTSRDNDIAYAEAERQRLLEDPKTPEQLLEEDLAADQAYRARITAEIMKKEPDDVQRGIAAQAARDSTINQIYALIQPGEPGYVDATEGVPGLLSVVPQGSTAPEPSRPDPEPYDDRTPVPTDIMNRLRGLRAVEEPPASD